MSSTGVQDAEWAAIRADNDQRWCRLMDWIGRRLYAEQRLLARYERGELVRRFPNHRSPWDTAIYATGKRTNKVCRWCGELINEPRRKYWHSACLDEMKVCDWNTTLGHIRRLHYWLSRYACEQCGDHGAELDHRRRLADWDSPEAHFFANLQWLCDVCHKAKSAGEMARGRINENQRGLFQVHDTAG
jgi:hypothetical protein